MKSHKLKTDAQVFQEVWDGKKQYEIRFDDRNFQVGDTFYLFETKYSGEEMKNGRPLIYTGRVVCQRIVHKLVGGYGIWPGWCILGMSELWKDTYSNLPPHNLVGEP